MQAVEPDLYMTQILELSDEEFKIIIINMLRALTEITTRENKWAM